MTLNVTTTKATTVRDLLNSGILGLMSDGSQRAPLGDMLAVLLDVANPAVVVAATTVGAAVVDTAAGPIVDTAVGPVAVTAAGPVVQTSAPTAQPAATTPANVAYTQVDQTALADLANALEVLLNLVVADITALTTQVNALIVDDTAAIAQLNAAITDNGAQTTQVNALIVDDGAVTTRLNQARVDILALRAELAAALVGTVGGATETGVVPVANVATMAASASSIISVRATAAGTTGVKKLVRDPTHTLVTGEVFWNGTDKLTFAAIDAVTACDLLYSTASGSQKVSALMADATPIQ
jgi:hypothetical protein